MSAHKFTKKEKRVFYLNLIVAIIGFVLSLNITIFKSPDALVASSVYPAVGSSIMGTAFIGMFALLLSAQFAHCWTIVYMIAQILLILNIAVLAITTGVFSSLFFSAFKKGIESLDPDTIASLKNMTMEVDSFMTRNPDTGKWYATLESTFSFCGFYDYNDALGVGSSHSDPETCRLYKTPLLSLCFTFVAKLLKSTCTWITIYLLIEIVVLVFICTILKVEPEAADVPVMPLLSSPEVKPQPYYPPQLAQPSMAQAPQPAVGQMTQPAMAQGGAFPALPVTAQSGH